MDPAVAKVVFATAAGAVVGDGFHLWFVPG